MNTVELKPELNKLNLERFINKQKHDACIYRVYFEIQQHLQ